MKISPDLKNVFKFSFLLILITGFSENMMAQETHRLEIHFSGLKPHSGSEILIGVYDQKQEFLSDNVFQTYEIPTQGKTDFSHVIHLPKGEYALALFQDLNGDKELNKNFIGYPTEPFTFSNNAPVRFGPPKWKDAVFNHREDQIMKIAF